MKQTKIVASISDRRCDVAFLQSLYDAGINVVRINTAHAPEEGMRQVIENTRKVSKKLGILLDTKGPEIRTTVCETPIDYKTGEMVHICGNPDGVTTHDAICVSYPAFAIISFVTLYGASSLIRDSHTSSGSPIDTHTSV